MLLLIGGDIADTEAGESRLEESGTPGKMKSHTS